MSTPFTAIFQNLSYSVHTDQVLGPPKLIKYVHVGHCSMEVIGSQFDTHNVHSLLFAVWLLTQELGYCLSIVRLTIMGCCTAVHHALLFLIILACFPFLFVDIMGGLDPSVAAYGKKQTGTTYRRLFLCFLFS